MLKNVLMRAIRVSNYKINLRQMAVCNFNFCSSNKIEEINTIRDKLLAIEKPSEKIDLLRQLIDSAEKNGQTDTIGYFNELFELSKIYFLRKDKEKCKITLQKILDNQKHVKESDLKQQDQFLYNLALWSLDNYQQEDFLLKFALQISQIKNIDQSCLLFKTVVLEKNYNIKFKYLELTEELVQIKQEIEIIIQITKILYNKNQMSMVKDLFLKQTVLLQNINAMITLCIIFYFNFQALEKQLIENITEKEKQSLIKEVYTSLYKQIRPLFVLTNFHASGIWIFSNQYKENIEQALQYNSLALQYMQKLVKVNILKENNELNIKLLITYIQLKQSKGNNPQTFEIQFSKLQELVNKNPKLLVENDKIIFKYCEILQQMGGNHFEKLLPIIEFFKNDKNLSVVQLKIQYNHQKFDSLLEKKEINYEEAWISQKEIFQLYQEIPMQANFSFVIRVCELGLLSQKQKFALLIILIRYDEIFQLLNQYQENEMDPLDKLMHKTVTGRTQIEQQLTIQNKTEVINTLILNLQQNIIKGFQNLFSAIEILEKLLIEQKAQKQLITWKKQIIQLLNDYALSVKKDEKLQNIHQPLVGLFKVSTILEKDEIMAILEK